jgi:hypothetical protein
MAWAQLDDQLATHPKVHRLRARPQGLAALGLWTLALTWAHAHTRDKPPACQGVIPHDMPYLWVDERAGDDPQDLINMLVVAGLWDPLPDGGWRIHDFRYWQQLERREAQSAAGKRGNAKRWGGDQEQLPLGLPADIPASNGHATAPYRGAINDPSRPHPTPPHPTPTKQDQNTRAPVPGFDEFWKAYPRKTAKVAARRKWDQVVKTTDPEVIVSAAAAFAELWEAKLAAGAEPRFIPHPATWLNGGRWDDEMQDDAEAIRPQYGV